MAEGGDIVLEERLFKGTYFFLPFFQALQAHQKGQTRGSEVEKSPV